MCEKYAKGEKALRTTYLVLSFMPLALSLFLSDLIVRALMAFCFPLVVACGMSGAIETTTIMKPYKRLICTCALGAFLGFLVVPFRWLAYPIIFGGMIVYVLSQHWGRILKWWRSSTILGRLQYASPRERNEEIRRTEQGFAIRTKEDTTMKCRAILTAEEECSELRSLSVKELKRLKHALEQLTQTSNLHLKADTIVWQEEGCVKDGDICPVDSILYQPAKRVLLDFVQRGSGNVSSALQEIKRILATAEYIKGDEK